MVTSKGRRSFWQGFSLVGVLLLALFSSSAYANHNTKTHVTIGPAGGNGANPAFLDATNQDGSLAFFETDESLVSTDTDSRFDVYQRDMTSGAVTLISIGPAGGNGNTVNDDVYFDGISADGSKVFFETAEKLINGVGDNDGAVDIFQRSAGTTTMISAAGSGSDPDAFYDGNSSDGLHVFYDTDQAVTGTGDSDSSTDVYDGTGGSQVRVSAGAVNGNGAFTASYDGSSSDGTKVFFESFEQLHSSDTDSSRDIYQRASGATTLVSGGSGAFNPFYEGASADGSKVFFDTTEALVTGSCPNVAFDCDSSNDTYQRDSGGLTLISTGTTTNGAFNAFFEGSSQDGSKVFFRTAEKVESTDTDSSTDVWQRSSGATTQISTGTNHNGAFFASFDGSSTDGSRVFWSTAEQVETGDSDSSTDVYERSSGTTTRLSTGPNGGNGALSAFFEGSSTDGTRVFLTTAESLVSGDTDSADDIYERSGGNTTRLSDGTAGGNGPYNAFFDAANDSGRRVFLDTQEILLSSDTDSSIDVYANVTIPYEHPISASPLRMPLVSAYNGCTSANSTHGAPLNFPSCNPPARTSSTAMLGAGSVGFAELVVCDAASAVALCNEPGVVKPDVRLFANLRDVRCVGTLPSGCSAGADYNPNGSAGPYTTACTTIAGCGNATLASPFCAPSGTSSSACIANTDLTLTARHAGSAAGQGYRITDVRNGAGEDLGATTADSAFAVPMDCLPTVSSTVGSICAVNTSANALYPGAVRTNDASIWQVGEFQVADSGTDAMRGNGDDQIMAAQGVYLP
jgi:hypothetical protein